MATDDNQKNALRFFIDHLDSMDSFTKADLQGVTTWTESSFDTYWSKQFKPFVVELGSNTYRMSEAFRPYITWDKFQQHVTQVRRLASSDYRHEKYDLVRIYEFFMPLTNEAHLRTALDTLFYRDRLKARLKTVDRHELGKQIAKEIHESPEQYTEKICDWISQRFGGYSVYHVNGRFRAEELVDRDQAARMPRYLVDETTAVTRFIFPCKDADDAARVEFFFHQLFVQAVVEIVNAEDEIWMTETGMENRLHIWRIDRR